MKLIYKPLALLIGVLGGVLAGAIFKRHRDDGTDRYW